MDILYRGVNPEFYEKESGKLIPKAPGEIFSSYACCGQIYACCGSGFVCGDSVTNEVLRHQYHQLGLETSGISTTPHRDRAIFYATQGGKYTSGYIYLIQRALLKEYGIEEYTVSDYVLDPSIPEDAEVILVPSSIAIPENVYGIEIINFR